MTHSALRSSCLGTVAFLAMSCTTGSRAPQSQSPPPPPVVVPIPAQEGLADAGHQDDAPPLKTTTLAEQVRGVHRLGDALFVSLLVGDESKPAFRLARLGNDGTLTDVATDMPASHRTTMRNGEPTISGHPAALLGEPDGPIWMAFEHYSTFGDFTVYRADRGRWSCVGRCAKRPDPEPWGTFAETRVPTGEYVANGDLVTARSRGHLFALQNRVSGEGKHYVLAATEPDLPTRAVRGVRARDGDLVELADGSIVDVATAVPEATRVLAVDGRSPYDFWVLDESGLIHAKGAKHERRPRRKDVTTLVADVGGVWTSDGAIAYRVDGVGDLDPGVRIAEPKAAHAYATLVAARGHALLVLIEGGRLVRIALP